MNWDNDQTRIDRQIREATERGEFDHLPGAGKPLADNESHDENWWLRQYMQREELPGDGFLPQSLLLRKEAAAIDLTAGRLHSERAVREHLVDLNNRIMAELRMPSSRVSFPIGPVDVEEVVRRWRLHRAQLAAARPEPPPAAPARRRWFRRKGH